MCLNQVICKMQDEMKKLRFTKESILTHLECIAESEKLQTFVRQMREDSLETQIKDEGAKRSRANT
jgi:DNA polymerase III delta prime subunit